jgi:hypothetical protein
MIAQLVWEGNKRVEIKSVLAAAGLEKGKKCPPALASERHAA